MPPTSRSVPDSFFFVSRMLSEVSRMSANTRWLNCSSVSPVGVIWMRRPNRMNSGSLNSSSSSRI